MSEVTIPPTESKALPIHPAAELFPKLTGKEFEELVADIKAHGLIHPMVTIGEGADMKILAGVNRQRACIEAGVEPHYMPYQGDNPIAFVIGDNILRRHLDTKQKRELIAKLLKLQHEKSNRQHAAAAKVDHKTVASVRAEMEGRGEIPHVDSHTDSKERKQPAKKERRTEDDFAAEMQAKRAGKAATIKVVKPKDKPSIDTYVARVKIDVETAIALMPNDADHQALVFEKMRAVLNEMEQAHGGAKRAA